MAGPPKCKGCDWDKVPAELKAAGLRFVLWRYTGGTKVPFQPNGDPASVSDPSTWNSFETVRAAYRKRPNWFTGIGFVFTDDDDFVGVDFDDVYDEERNVREWVVDQLCELASYTEVSPSGGGVKTFVRGDIPKAFRGPHLEIYKTGRWFALTGERLDDYGETIEANQEALNGLVRLFETMPRETGGSGEGFAPVEGYEFVRGDAPTDHLAAARLTFETTRPRHRHNFLVQLAADLRSRVGCTEEELREGLVEAFRLFEDRSDFSDRELEKIIEWSVAEIPRSPKPHEVDALIATMEAEQNAAHDQRDAAARDAILDGWETWSFEDAVAEGEKPTEWLIDDVLAARQPALVVGPPKCLKTSTAIDMTIALATGTRFLGEFNVRRAVNVGLVSAESGVKTIGRIAARVAAARAAKPAPGAWELMTSLPKLSDPTHRGAIATWIERHELEVVFLDPAYLMLGIRPDDASNVFGMGEYLGALSEFLIRECGVTPVILHHSKKLAEKSRYEPLDLFDISFSGFAEYARQWILLNRSGPYSGGGVHHLHLSWGGSEGHTGLKHLTVDEGLISDEGGRKWDVTVSDEDPRGLFAQGAALIADFSEAAEKAAAEEEFLKRIAAAVQQFARPVGLKKIHEVIDPNPDGSRPGKGRIGGHIDKVVERGWIVETQVEGATLYSTSEAMTDQGPEAGAE